MEMFSDRTTPNAIGSRGSVIWRMMKSKTSQLENDHKTWRKHKQNSASKILQPKHHHQNTTLKTQRKSPPEQHYQNTASRHQHPSTTSRKHQRGAVLILVSVCTCSCFGLHNYPEGSTAAALETQSSMLEGENGIMNSWILFRSCR